MIWVSRQVMMIWALVVMMIKLKSGLTRQKAKSKVFRLGFLL